jgi:type I restriction enzyme M protein
LGAPYVRHVAVTSGHVNVIIHPLRGGAMNQEERQFPKELDKKLRAAANKLLPMLDATVYKHVALGLIFIKYVSDVFMTRREELHAAFAYPNDYYFGEDSAELRVSEMDFKMKACA